MSQGNRPSPSSLDPRLVMPLERNMFTRSKLDLARPDNREAPDLLQVIREAADLTGRDQKVQDFFAERNTD